MKTQALSETTYVLVYDIELRRPACVLLQIMMGGTLPEFTELFMGAKWLVDTTPNLKRYRVTLEQAKKIAERSVKA